MEVSQDLNVMLYLMVFLGKSPLAKQNRPTERRHNIALTLFSNLLEKSSLLTQGVIWGRGGQLPPRLYMYPQ